MRASTPLALFLVAFALVRRAAAAPAGQTTGVARAVLEAPSAEHDASTLAKGYTRAHRAAADSRVLLSVAVTQQNTAKLLSTLNAVSDPDSADYGAFLSHEQVQELVAPSAEAFQTVMTWLRDEGVEGTKATPNGDFVTAEVSVAQAEKILQCEYHVYQHAASGTNVTRVAGSYTLPRAVSKHVDFVAPTTTFPPAPSAKNLRAGAKPAIVPARLRGLTNLSNSTGKGTASPLVQGVASFLKQYYLPADLKAFHTKYKMTGALVPTDKPATQKHTPVGVEASLDIQWIMVTGARIKTEFWSTEGKQPGNPENEPFVAWLTALAADATPPSLFSISYGDDEPGVSKAYAMRAAVEFQKAGVRGISLMSASGDGGVGCGTNGFVPTFPGSCPWVTAVGGAQGGTVGQSPTGEGAWESSGGGFSNYFGRPSYQDGAVQAYISSALLPPRRKWNASGAGFPDIAAQSVLFDTCTNNFFYPYSGTSAASPAATGVLAMLAQASRAGKPMGWLNPLLYKLGAANSGTKGFNDVTDGTNDACGQPDGFTAARGWDPVTGWGTLNFGKLQPLFEATAPAAHDDTTLRKRYDTFLSEHNKTPKDYTQGLRHYARNELEVASHNTVNSRAGFQVELNKFADMATEAVPRGYSPDAAPVEVQTRLSPHTKRVQDLPASVDWRQHGAVSPVRDQGQGSTCWAFSTAGAVEGARVAQHSTAAMVPLSPQSLIDCMGIDCSESTGTMDKAFYWVARHGNGTMYSWASYPYADGDCIFWDPPHGCHKNGTLVPGPQVTGQHHTIVNNETDLMAAVALSPVSVAIYTGLATFTTYKSGVYDDAGCKGVTKKQLDHAVLVVGYGTSAAGKAYWLVKNSWGEKWGESGFFRMARGQNLCGIAIDASYPITA